MAKGSKTCPSCSKTTGCRAHSCTCGHIFSSALRSPQVNQPIKTKEPKKRSRKKNGELRKKRTKKIPLSWKDLRSGDWIKIVAGSGPRYITNEGLRIPIGYKGQYKVLYLDENGIHAIGIGKKSVSGHAFIWMNGRQQNGAFLRKPHKISRLRQAAIQS